MSKKLAKKTDKITLEDIVLNRKQPIKSIASLSDPKIRDIFIHHYATGSNFTSAGNRVGIRSQTVYNYLKNNPAVRISCEQAREEMLGGLKARLVRVLETSKDPYAIMKMIEKLSQQRHWGDPVEKNPDVSINLVAQADQWLETSNKKRRRVVAKSEKDDSDRDSDKLITE